MLRVESCPAPEVLWDTPYERVDYAKVAGRERPEPWRR